MKYCIIIRRAITCSPLFYANFGIFRRIFHHFDFAANEQMANLSNKIATTSVRVLNQVDPGSTETEYTLANGAKLSDYKMLYVTRSWYSTVVQSLCIPADCLQYASLFVQNGNDYVKVSYSSDTKVKVEANTTNMRCSVWLTR